MLKNSNHFIVLATTKEGEVIGFIHYQFCWFRPRVRNILSLEEVALERVLHVESIHFRETKACGESDMNKFSNTNDCIVLLSLAFEHARFHAIYGMMNVKPVFASILKNYFRASEVGYDDDQVLLACDLQKCSYRYAFHFRNEEGNKNSTNALVSRHRLLVQLPTIIRKVSKQSAVTGSGKNETPISKPPPDKELISKSAEGCENKTGNVVETKLPVSKSSTEKNLDSKKKDETAIASVPIGNESLNFRQMRRPCDDRFSASLDSSSQKTITVRLENKKITVRKAPINRSPQKGSKKQSVKEHLVQESWNTISCFPVPVSSEKPCTLENDAVLSSLKLLQQELAAFEKTNLSTLENLFLSVSKERKLFEHEKRKRNADARVVLNYENEIKKRNDAQKALEEQQEEDDNAVCDICGDGESTGENRIIFCDMCDVSVHQHCYGVENVPHGDYFCRACLHFKKTQPETYGNDQSQNAVQKRAPTLPPIKCELCPKKHGAYVQAQCLPASGKSDPLSKWVHFLCAKWQGISIVEGATNENGEPLFLIENVQPFKDHFLLEGTKCFLCKGMRGTYY